MDIAYFIVGCFVIGVVLFNRDLLFRPHSFRVILGISVAMFLVGVVVTLAKLGPGGSLLNPIVSLGLFELMRRIFYAWLKRNPVDTFLNWQAGMAADRWFNIAYFTFAFMCSAIVAGTVDRSAAALL